MQRVTARIKRESILLSATILYAVTVSLVFPYLRYYVNNPDTISYLTIAGKYVHGDFAAAVNGYWSPMISWMLASLYLWIGNDILAFKVLQLLIGWISLYHFTRLTQFMVRSTILRYTITFASIPFFISYSLLNLTPDLLFLSVVLFYLRVVSEREFFNYRHFGIIAGLLGVFLYFSKSFGYFFFLAHFSVLLFRNYIVTKEYAFKKHLRGNYFLALIFFFLITSTWVYLISVKYGHFTISKNVYVNLSKEVAAGPGKENTLPVLSGGLYKPANSSAVNAWEDPGSAVKFTPIHPLSNHEDMQLYSQVLARNFLTIYYFDFRNQTGFIFILLLVILLFTSRRKKIWTDDYVFSTVSSLLLIYAGYSLILVHSRYTWVCTLLMMLISARLIEELLSGKKIQWMAIPVAGFLLAALAIKRPVKEILFTGDKPIGFSNLLKAITHPVPVIKHTYHTDFQFFSEINEMKKIVHSGENIISIYDPNAERDCYTRSSLLAYFSGAKYYGQLTMQQDVNDLSSDLLKTDHIVAFSIPEMLTDSSGWKLAFDKEEIPLKIYSEAAD